MALTEKQILESLIPEAEVESITFETNKSGDEEGIFVRIIYSISDVVEQDVIGQWFDQQEYEKYFLLTTLMKVDNNIPIMSIEKSALSNSTAGQLLESTDDSRIKKFTFEKTYLLNEQPKDLKFTIETKFDIRQMETDFGIDLFDLTKISLIKRKEIDIYKNEQLQYPIQDFRLREEIKKFELSEERIQIFEFLKREVTRKAELSRQNAKDFFSDFWLTRNAQGEAKFVFIFDAASFFLKKSKYREIFERLNALERYEIIRRVQIPSLKILRKRVRVVQDKNGRSVIDFKDEYSLKEIVETRKVANRGGFDKVVTDDGSIMQINITGVSANALEDNNLLFVTGTDYDIAGVTDGVYSYGVSIEVIDTTRQILLDKLKVLKDRINLVENILSSSLLPKFYDAQTDMYKMPLDEIVADENKINKFRSTKSRVRNVYRVFIGGNKSSNSLRVDNFFRMDMIKSPKELELIIDVMKSLLNNAASIIGESNDYFTGKKDASASDLRIIEEKFYSEPNNIFDSNIPKMEGMEYLSNFGTDDPDAAMREIMSLAKDNGDVGLRVIDGGEYESRVSDEISRFFDPGTTQVTVPMLNTQTTGTNAISLTGTGSEFFTVSAVTSPITQPSIFSGRRDVSVSNAIVQEDIIRNMERYIPGVPIYASIDESKGAAYLARSGANFGDSSKQETLIDEDSGRSFSTSRTRRLPDRIIERLEQETRRRASEDYVARKAFEDFIFSKVSKEVKRSIGAPRIASAANLPSGAPGSVFEGMTTVKKRETIEGAPNQVVAYSLLPQDEVNESSFVVSSEFLTKISYLSGFEQDGSKENVRLPKWESLTLDAYRNNSNKNLLCKINPYHAQKLGIIATQSKTPIYDAFFVVKPVGTFVYEYEDEEQQRTTSDLLTAGMELVRETIEVENQISDVREQIEHQRALIDAHQRRADEISEEMAELNAQLDRARANETSGFLGITRDDFSGTYETLDILMSEYLGITEVTIPRIRERIESFEDFITELQERLNNL